jgi:hypothetical protein
VDLIATCGVQTTTRAVSQASTLQIHLCPDATSLTLHRVARYLLHVLIELLRGSQICCPVRSIEMKQIAQVSEQYLSQIATDLRTRMLEIKELRKAI